MGETIRKENPSIYYCNEVGHIKSSCPRLTKTNVETVAFQLKSKLRNEELFRNSEFQGTSQIRGSERKWEKPSRKEKTHLLLPATKLGTLKPACPKLMKIDFETVVSLRVTRRMRTVSKI
ncbi:hypothetical protein TNCV_1264261 [Trichonephila clavipes]|nr:hypothetical protein TNCV_1264261 [Trichonephila clavipes]